MDFLIRPSMDKSQAIRLQVAFIGFLSLQHQRLLDNIQLACTACSHIPTYLPWSTYIMYVFLKHCTAGQSIIPVPRFLQWDGESTPQNRQNKPVQCLLYHTTAHNGKGCIIHRDQVHHTMGHIQGRGSYTVTSHSKLCLTCNMYFS